MDGRRDHLESGHGFAAGMTMAHPAVARCPLDGGRQRARGRLDPRQHGVDRVLAACDRRVDVDTRVLDSVAAGRRGRKNDARRSGR